MIPLCSPHPSCTSVMYTFYGRCLCFMNAPCSTTHGGSIRSFFRFWGFCLRFCCRPLTKSVLMICIRQCFECCYPAYYHFLVFPCMHHGSILRHLCILTLPLYKGTISTSFRFFSSAREINNICIIASAIR